MVSAGVKLWIDELRATVYYGVCMQTIEVKTVLCVLVTGALALTGCASRSNVGQAEPNAPGAPVQISCPEGVTTAEIIAAAEHVLTRMQFGIEKLDAGHGIVKTRPLRGAQFFELWRSDNASVSNWEEANVQSIRRTVEVRVRTEDRGRRTEDGETGRLCVACAVSVQRLSLPESTVAGTSEAYRIHVGSAPALQRLRVGPHQRQEMTWIDLGQDRDLAARILTRVEQRLQHADR